MKKEKKIQQEAEHRFLLELNRDFNRESVEIPVKSEILLIPKIKEPGDLEKLKDDPLSIEVVQPGNLIILVGSQEKKEGRKVIRPDKPKGLWGWFKKLAPVVAVDESEAANEEQKAKAFKKAFSRWLTFSLVVFAFVAITIFIGHYAKDSVAGQIIWQLKWHIVAAAGLVTFLVSGQIRGAIWVSTFLVLWVSLSAGYGSLMLHEEIRSELQGLSEGHILLKYVPGLEENLRERERRIQSGTNLIINQEKTAENAKLVEAVAQLKTWAENSKQKGRRYFVETNRKAKIVLNCEEALWLLERITCQVAGKEAYSFIEIINEIETNKQKTAALIEFGREWRAKHPYAPFPEEKSSAAAEIREQKWVLTRKLANTDKILRGNLEKAYVKELFSVFNKLPEDQALLKVREFNEHKLDLWAKVDAIGGTAWKARSQAIFAAFRKFRSPRYFNRFCLDLEIVENRIKKGAKGMDNLPLPEKLRGEIEKLAERHPWLGPLLLNFTDEELQIILKRQRSYMLSLIDKINLEEISRLKTQLKGWNARSKLAKSRFFANYLVMLNTFQAERHKVFHQAKLDELQLVRGKLNGNWVSSDTRLEAVAGIDFWRWLWNHSNLSSRIVMRWETKKNAAGDTLCRRKIMEFKPSSWSSWTGWKRYVAYGLKLFMAFLQTLVIIFLPWYLILNVDLWIGKKLLHEKPRRLYLKLRGWQVITICHLIVHSAGVWMQAYITFICVM